MKKVGEHAGGGVIDLDDTDQAIIALLRQDGRMAYRAIARALDIAENTVRGRVRRHLVLRHEAFRSAQVLPCSGDERRTPCHPSRVDPSRRVGLKRRRLVVGSGDLRRPDRSRRGIYHILFCRQIFYLIFIILIVCLIQKKYKSYFT